MMVPIGINTWGCGIVMGARDGHMVHIVGHMLHIGIVSVLFIVVVYTLEPTTIGLVSEECGVVMVVTIGIITWGCGIIMGARDGHMVHIVGHMVHIVIVMVRRGGRGGRRCGGGG